MQGVIFAIRRAMYGAGVACCGMVCFLACFRSALLDAPGLAVHLTGAGGIRETSGRLIYPLYHPQKTKRPSTQSKNRYKQKRDEHLKSTHSPTIRKLTNYSSDTPTVSQTISFDYLVITRTNSQYNLSL